MDVKNGNRKWLVVWLAAFVAAQSVVPILAQLSVEVQGALNPHMEKPWNAIDSAGLAGIRLIIGGLLLLPFASCPGSGPPFAVVPLRRYAGFGLVAFSVAHALNFVGFGLEKADATHQALIEGTMIGGACILLAWRRAFSQWRVLVCALVVVFGAMAFLLPESKSRLTGGFRVEHFLWFASALVSITALLLSTRIFKEQSGIQAALRKTSFSALFGGGFLLVGWLLAHCIASGHAIRFPIEVLPWLFALAFVGTGLGWLSLFLVMERDETLAFSGIVAAPALTVGDVWYMERFSGPSSVRNHSLLQWICFVAVVGALVTMAWLRHNYEANRSQRDSIM